MTYTAIRLAAAVLVMTAVGACSSEEPTKKDQTSTAAMQGEMAVLEDKSPNILFIVLDDVGYTDLGVFGSEIPTPNIDSLAANGTLLTSFYAAPNCSPTRSMLLSGTDSHIAGLGNMSELLADNQRGNPGYEGYLNQRVATIAEVLGESGYSTYMTGKWHLGFDEETSPAARGFQRSFAMLEGGAGHFDNMLAYGGRKPGDLAKYREDGKMLTSLPEGFYSSKFYAEQMIDYIEQGQETGKPFFGYLAFTAAHWPLQAPKESIARHRGNYDTGWDELFEKRNAALKETGFVPQDLVPSPNLLGVQAWEELSEEEQAIQARIMEVYAAMIEDADIYTGKVIDYLKSIGEFENTFIVFMSDNGAEGHGRSEASPKRIQYVAECCDNSLENIGAPNSYVWPGSAWARASVGPWKLFKGFPSDGGTRVPAIVHYPNVVGVDVNPNFMTVKDIMPTVLDLLDIEHPAPRFLGREVAAMQGQSLLPVLTGDASDINFDEKTMGWELFGKKALRYGQWKILAQQESEFFEQWSKEVDGADPFQWRLYNLAEDPSESNDLAASHPEMLKDMLMRWEAYMKENSVVLPDRTFGY